MSQYLRFSNPRYVQLISISAATVMAALVTAAWTFSIFNDWGTDYGVYYVGSAQIDSDTHLYRDLSDHKGPLYYGFIKIFSSIIGYGFPQATIILFATVYLFMLTVMFVSKYLLGWTIASWFTLTVALAMLYGQNTNASIALFQSTFILLYIFLLLKCYYKADIRMAQLAAFFLALACLVRIDAIIFAPLLLIFLVRPNTRHRREFRPARYLIVISSTLLISGAVVYSLLAFYLDFAISDYISSNIQYNYLMHDNNTSWGSAEFFVRRQLLSILLESQLAAVVALVFVAGWHLTGARIKHFSQTTMLRVYANNNKYSLLYIAVISFVIGIIGMVVTGVDKDYYLYIVYTPALLLMATYLRIIHTSGPYSGVLACGILILIAPIAIWSTPNIKSALNVLQHERPIGLINSSDVALANSIEAHTDTGDGQPVPGIFNRSWVYLESDTAPAFGLNPVMMFEVGFINDQHLKEYNALLRNEGALFWLDSRIQIRQQFHPLIDNSVVLEQFGVYELRQIQQQ